MYFTTLCSKAEPHPLVSLTAAALISDHISHRLECCRCAVAGQTDSISLRLACHQPAVVCTTRLCLLCSDLTEPLLQHRRAGRLNVQLLDPIVAAACSIVVGETCCRSVGRVTTGRGACNMCTDDVFISFHTPCVYSCSLCSSCCWVCVVAVLASVCCGQQIVHCRGLHLIEPRHVSCYFPCCCGCYDCCR